MTLVPFLLILFIWQVFENFRLQERLNKIEYKVVTVSALEAVQSTELILDILLEQNIIVLPEPFENTIEGRNKATYKILEQTMPLALKRFEKYQTEQI